MDRSTVSNEHTVELTGKPVMLEIHSGKIGQKTRISETKEMEVKKDGQVGK